MIVLSIWWLAALGVRCPEVNGYLPRKARRGRSRALRKKIVARHDAFIKAFMINIKSPGASMSRDDRF